MAERPRPQAAAPTNLLLCHSFHGDGGKVPPPPRAMLWRRWGRGPGGGAGGGRREGGNGCGGRQEGWGCCGGIGRADERLFSLMNDPCVDTHAHTLALVCADTLGSCVCASDQRLLEGYLEVSHKHCEGPGSPGAAAHLHVSFIWKHTHTNTPTHNSISAFYT